MFFDRTPYMIPSSASFEKELLQFLDNHTKKNQQQSYPRFDMIQIDDTHYRIDIASAGYNPEDFEAVQNETELVISAKSIADTNQNYIERGLSYTAWTRKFYLKDYIELEKLEYVNGIVRIHLVKNVPEEKKPKVFKIETKQLLKG